MTEVVSSFRKLSGISETSTTPSMALLRCTGGFSSWAQAASDLDSLWAVVRESRQQLIVRGDRRRAEVNDHQRVAPVLFRVREEMHEAIEALVVDARERRRRA